MSEQAQPVRIHRRRSKGWHMPPNTIYVGRPTRWGNPWTVGLAACGCRSAGECTHNTFRCATAADAVEAYRIWLTELHLPERLEAKLAPLRDKNLACWCPLDQPCHADVLLELASKAPADIAKLRAGAS